MKKLPIILLVLGGVLILVLAVFLLLPKDSVEAPQSENKTGIIITTPKPGETITSPVIIAGWVNGGGWGAFEGQVGTVTLLDASGKELASTYLPATEDWMKPSVHFEAMMYFDYPGDGAGQLVFHNENASGLPELDKTFTLPVKLSKSSGDKTKIKLYFNNGKLENGTDCEAKFYAEREIPKTQAIARAALEELLKGPTNLENQLTEKQTIFSSHNEF